MKQKAKSEGLKNLKSTWEEKPFHGHYPLQANNADVDQKKPHQWLRSSELKSETEGFIVAAQHQSLLTKNYQAKLMKNRADPRYRIYFQYEETIDHLISGCPTLAPNEYLDRHKEKRITSTGRSVNVMEPNMLKTGLNISQNLSQKLIMLPSYGIPA